MVKKLRLCGPNPTSDNIQKSQETFFVLTWPWLRIIDIDTVLSVLGIDFTKYGFWTQIRICKNNLNPLYRLILQDSRSFANRVWHKSSGFEKVLMIFRLDRNFDLHSVALRLGLDLILANPDLDMALVILNATLQAITYSPLFQHYETSLAFLKCLQGSSTNLQRIKWSTVILIWASEKALLRIVFN